MPLRLRSLQVGTGRDEAVAGGQASLMRLGPMPLRLKSLQDARCWIPR